MATGIVVTRSSRSIEKFLFTKRISFNPEGARQVAPLTIKVHFNTVLVFVVVWLTYSPVVVVSIQ